MMSLDDWPPPNNSSAVASIHGVPPPESFRVGETPKEIEFSKFRQRVGPRR